MKIEDALLLLTAVSEKELSVKEAIEVIELVTKNPEMIKKVLLTAEERGLIQRDGKRLFLMEGSTGFPAPRVRRVDCESSCRRCNIRIKNCYYIMIEDRELGPYGSECVQKIKG